MGLKVNAKAAALLLDHEGLNNFSQDGLTAILKLLDDCGCEMDFNAIDFASTWIEYGEGVPFSFNELRDDYDYLLYGDDPDNPDDSLRDLIDELEERTTVIELRNGNIAMVAF